MTTDGRVCMIFRQPRRIVADACIGRNCRQSLNACQAGRDINNGQSCCAECRHQ